MIITFLIIFYPLVAIISILFTQLSHPLAIGLRLLFQTILICCITGLSNISFWFSYILFLIFLGGILVLFIYVTSLASNEIFKPSSVLIIIVFIILIIRIFVNFIDPIILPQFKSLKIAEISKITPYSIDLSLVSTIYNPTTINLTIFIIFYLLLTLVVVVKITDTFFGPLRLSTN